MRDEFKNSENWHTRGFMAHYDAENKYQMITYRLADSLPISSLPERGNNNLIYQEGLNPGSTGGPPVKSAQDKIKDLERRKAIESILDRGLGSCILTIPKIGETILDNWNHFDGVRYDLVAGVVMPNHVHILIKTYSCHSLAKIIHSWKSYTAHEISKYLKEMKLLYLRTGEPPVLPGIDFKVLEKKIWQVEYWDRFIRDEKHFAQAVNYILENPVKAGLCKKVEDWQWIIVRAQNG